MRDEQHPNQDEANIPDQNKQTDSLEESLREYQERKRQEFQLNISGLDDIGDESPEIYSKKSEYDVEPHMAEEIESHSHNTPKKESQASQQNLKAQTMTKEQKKKIDQTYHFRYAQSHIYSTNHENCCPEYRTLHFCSPLISPQVF